MDDGLMGLTVTPKLNQDEIFNKVIEYRNEMLLQHSSFFGCKTKLLEKVTKIQRTSFFLLLNNISSHISSILSKFQTSLRENKNRISQSFKSQFHLYSLTTFLNISSGIYHVVSLTKLLRGEKGEHVTQQLVLLKKKKTQKQQRRETFSSDEGLFFN